jgi:hypothetical protein
MAEVIVQVGAARLLLLLRLGSLRRVDSISVDCVHQATTATDGDVLTLMMLKCRTQDVTTAIVVIGVKVVQVEQMVVVRLVVLLISVVRVKAASAAGRLQ